MDALDTHCRAGTAAREMLQEAPRLAAIIVPVGGGGLAAGSALAATAHNPRLRVIGVEPAGADDTRRGSSPSPLL
ncbi:pyridoxal-phosphate dependent enzyme [Streptomyces sp. NPDC050485]|uniref:pyridoxal-phosphate dependent enzyme n=1 Tax=Streptomyces sp. NPDC050485 TaxID=3365617 RepID=UPI0037AE7E49